MVVGVDAVFWSKTEILPVVEWKDGSSVVLALPWERMSQREFYLMYIDT
jgi:hypothetical protein